MNSFLILTILSLLMSLATGGLVCRGRHIGSVIVTGTACFFCSYVFGTMALFVLDQYTLFRGMAVTAMLDAAAFCAAFALLRPKPFSWEKLLRFRYDLRPLVIPVTAMLLVLPFTAQKNALFGMGQDQGVYQTVAINFMNGLDDRQQDFEEYHLLETDAERFSFQVAQHLKLVGYDIPEADYPDTVYDRSVSEVSGIYHGIPTYAAILAMWGELFGMKHMMEVQTVFLLLAIGLMCMITRNFKLRQSSRLIAAVVTGLSPEVLWVSKSSLTEMFLAVLMLLFLYLVTEKHWRQVLSIVPAAAFACYHVSVYTMVPLFLIVYGGMYFFTRRRCFAVLMPVTVIGYLASFFMMRQVQPMYTLNNYSPVFVGGITVHTVSKTVIAACGVLLLVCAGYLYLVHRFGSRKVLYDLRSAEHESAVLQYLMRIMLLVPLLYIGYKVLRSADSISTAGSLTIIGYLFHGGLFLGILAILMALIRPQIFTKSTRQMVLFILFFYCVLVYSAFLRFDIRYYYYYGRYLVPFLPIAVLFFVTALDQLDVRITVLAAAAGMVLTMPYSAYLLHHRDDTWLEWETLEDVTDQITSQDCVVIDQSEQRTFWLPVRAITGAHVYPAERDHYAQMQRLAERYDNVYFLTDASYTYEIDENLEIVYQNIIHLSTTSQAIRTTPERYGRFVPLPTEAFVRDDHIRLYRWLKPSYVYDANALSKWEITGIDTPDGDWCWTDSETASVRCILMQEDLELTVDLASVIPLREIGLRSMDVTLYVGGIEVGTAQIDSTNNGGALVFEIPAELVEDGSNIIALRSPLWSASVVNPEDDRMIGLPLQSLVFAPQE